MDPFTWTSKVRITSSIQELCADPGCNPEDPPEKMENRDAREGQGYPCWLRDVSMMMMMMMMKSTEKNAVNIL